MMKRILFLAPYSIPVNNPEAICNAKLLKVLSEAGFVIDVISKNNLTAYAPDLEESTFTNHLASVKTFYLSNKIGWTTILDHLRVFLKTGYVYKGAHWAFYAIHYAECLLREHKYDCILSRSPSAELAALYLSQKHHIKWIANWNDPYPEKRMPHPYGEGKDGKLTYWENKLLNKVSGKADWHTFPSERLRDYMLQYMKGASVERTAIIPHVCLEQLFIPAPKENTDKLIFVHSGNVSSPRNPQPFLEGVRLFLERVKGAQIEIRFIGKQTDSFDRQVGSLGLENVVKVVPPLNYIDNLAFIAGCDIAFLIEAPSDNSVYLPTKVGDYMQCRKAVFAVSPLVGTLRDLYEQGTVEYFADCTDPAAISRELEKIYARKEEYKQESKNVEIYEKYTDRYVLDIYTQIIGK